MKSLVESRYKKAWAYCYEWGKAFSFTYTKDLFIGLKKVIKEIDNDFAFEFRLLDSYDSTNYKIFTVYTLQSRRFTLYVFDYWDDLVRQEGLPMCEKFRASKEFCN